MSFHGRSPDDQPLAAYSTGVTPDVDEMSELDPDPGYTSVPAPSTPTADMQHGHAPAQDAPDPDVPAKKGRGRSLSIKLPALGRGKAAALQQAAPFQPVAGAATSAFQAVSDAPGGSAAFQAAPASPASRPFEPVTRPAGGPPSDKPGGRFGGKPKPAGTAGTRQLPRLSVRDPRVLAGGTIVVGVVLLGISLLGGGGANPGSGGPGNSQDNTGALPTPAVLGNASVELTGGGTGTYALTSATGAGPAVENQVNATWTDPLGESLGLAGLASQGTRATDANFVLTWTMLIDNVAVTFTSNDGECVIGMAVGVRAVHGSINCKALKSDDGKHLVSFRGTYTT
jgi:hypothetical protein